jgi:hypothetical protein
MSYDENLFPLIKLWNSLQKKFIKKKEKINSDNIKNNIFLSSANNIYDIKYLNNNIFKKNNSFNIKRNYYEII